MNNPSNSNNNLTSMLNTIINDNPLVAVAQVLPVILSFVTQINFNITLILIVRSCIEYPNTKAKAGKYTTNTAEVITYATELAGNPKQLISSKYNYEILVISTSPSLIQDLKIIFKNLIVPVEYVETDLYHISYEFAKYYISPNEISDTHDVLLDSFMSLILLNMVMKSDALRSKINDIIRNAKGDRLSSDIIKYLKGYNTETILDQLIELFTIVENYKESDVDNLHQCTLEHVFGNQDNYVPTHDYINPSEERIQGVIDFITKEALKKPL